MRDWKSILLCATMLTAFLCPADHACAEVGIDEHLGQTIPPDITLLDEEGRMVSTGDIINGPTIFSLVYLGCRKMCPLLLRGEAEVISGLEQKPGQGYNLVSVSFDENDTPEDARKARGIYVEAAGLAPESDWKFLTGNKESIDRLTEALGFRFERTGDGFSHVAALIVVSPKARIVRYIYGIKFLPFDIRMALAEAERETVGLSAKGALLYCFRYDPEGKRYVFNILKVTGTVTILSAIILFAYLVRSSRKRREEQGGDADE